MKIAGVYSFNGGADIVRKKYSKELDEVSQILTGINTKKYKTKRSKEKTMLGKVLYSPRGLNKAISNDFLKLGWQKQKVHCDYPTQYYSDGYEPPKVAKMLSGKWISLRINWALKYSLVSILLWSTTSVPR